MVMLVAQLRSQLHKSIHILMMAVRPSGWPLVTDQCIPSNTEHFEILSS